MPARGRIVLRLIAAGVVVAAAVAPWWLTIDRGDDLRTLVLGLYRDRWFMLNVASTFVALQAIALLHSPTRKRLINLILFNVSLGIGAAVVELPSIAGFIDFQSIGQAYRAAPDQGVSRVTQPNLRLEGESWPDLVTLLGAPSAKRPFSIQTDRYGLRNASDVADPRVVCLGDSILYAGFLRTDELLTERLARLLEAPVLNVSEPGLSPEEEMNRFAMTGVTNNGRIFLQFIFEGNDLGGSAAFTSEGVVDTGGDWPESGVLKFILRKLHAPRPGIAETRKGRFADASGESDVYFFYDAVEVDRSIGHLDALADYLDRRHDELAAAGSRYIVVFVPMKLTVLGPYCSWPESSRIADPRFRTSEFRAQVTDACLGRSIPLVDLTADLQQAAESGELVYFFDDTHLNARGHEVAAESIATYLRDTPDALVTP